MQQDIGIPWNGARTGNLSIGVRDHFGAMLGPGNKISTENKSKMLVV